MTGNGVGDLWAAVGALCAFVAVWSGIVFGLLGWIMKRGEAHVALQISRLADKVTDLATSSAMHGGRVATVERELLSLRAEVARDYVRRDDWIRFGVTIHNKLDQVHQRIDDLVSTKRTS